jgi:hypothetical protein
VNIVYIFTYGDLDLEHTAGHLTTYRSLYRRFHPHRRTERYSVGRLPQAASSSNPRQSPTCTWISSCFFRRTRVPVDYHCQVNQVGTSAQHGCQMALSPIGWHVLACRPLSRQTRAPNSPLMCGPLPARGCAGHQARAHHCLPPSEQRDGGTRAQEDQNCLACVWCRPGVAVSRQLGLRAVPKEESAVSSAELVTGSLLIPPGQLLHVPDPPRVDVPASYAVAANSPLDHLAGAEHGRVGGQQKPLAAPCAGPYQVVATGGKTFTIQVGQRQDHLKANNMVLARCLMQRPLLAAVFPRSRPLLRSSLGHLEAADKHVQYG